MRRRIAFLIATLAFTPSSVRAGDDEGEEVVGPLPWHVDDDTVFLRRIVEAATGKPVAGATVKLFCEVPHPEPGFGTPAATGSSGADGWVRIRKEAVDRRVADVYGEPSWAYVEAPGLRPDACMNEFLSDRFGGMDWSLPPSTTLRVALRDPLDRPVAGVLVGWILGCGHTPDVRQARTGADGVAALEGAGTAEGLGQLWPFADGLRASKNYVQRSWVPWERPKIETLEWSMTVEGTILTREGKPAAGVAVGLWSCHRGPWTHTDRDGRFRLVGSEAGPGDDVQVEVGEYAVGPPATPATGLTASLWFTAPPPGHRAVVRVGATDDPSDSAADAKRLVVEPDRTGWLRTNSAPPLEVFAIRVSDGWTTSATVGEQGVALLSVPPGAYGVEGRGQVHGGAIVHSRARAEVLVPPTGAYVRLAMPPPAVQLLRFEAPGGLEEVAAIVDGATTVVPIPDEDGIRLVEVFLPTDRDVALRIRQGPRTRLQPLDRTTLVPGRHTDELLVAPFASVDVRARFVGSEGKPAAGWLLEDESVPERPSGSASATPSLRILSGERVTLVAWPDDEARFQPSYVDVASARPREGGGPVDLGEIRLAPRAPSLTLARADGKPYEDEAVLVTRGDRAEVLRGGEGPPAKRVLDPWHEPGILVEGALVRVPHLREGQDTDEVPFVRRLEGPGPWTIRAPGGALTVEARDENGAPLSTWSLHLDNRHFAASGDAVHLSTLDAGPHEVVVEAEGMTPRRLRFTLADGEQRTWTARLRPAAATPR